MKHYIITFSAFVIVGLSYIKISRLIRASCIICVIFLNLCILCSAQKANFRYFSVDEGLPQATVYEMLLDNEGYLWFGTQGGIARYNGRTFDIYNQQNGLAGNHVVKLYQDSKNNIWIGYRYEGVSKLVLPVPPNNPGGNEGEGSLSKNGNNDKKGDSFPSMAGHETGFYHYKDQLRGIDKAISDILEDDLGNIWIGTKGNGIYVLNKAIKEIGEIKELTTENGFRSNNINALEKDGSGNIWVGTDEAFI
ncbi:MAG: hypothetical protein IIA88_09510 [Bacteroidetes bacterium]|nr:hypothetical protein [Bacteroidota bacterium]